MPSETQRKANNALGVFCVALVFLAESVVAYQHRPSPASPWIWAAQAAVAWVALVYFFRHRDRSATSDHDHEAGDADSDPPTGTSP